MSLHLSHILSHCISIESLYPITSPFFLFIFVGKIPHFVKAPHLVIVLGLVVVLSFFFQFCRISSQQREEQSTTCTQSLVLLGGEVKNGNGKPL